MNRFPLAIEGLVRISRDDGNPIVGEIEQTHDTGEEYLTTPISIAVAAGIGKLSVILEKEWKSRTQRPGLLKLTLKEAKQLHEVWLIAIQQVER